MSEKNAMLVAWLTENEPTWNVIVSSFSSHPHPSHAICRPFPIGLFNSPHLHSLPLLPIYRTSNVYSTHPDFGAVAW